jgi:hypothetical protein
VKKKTSRYDDYMTNMILGVFSFAFFLTVGLMATNRGFGRVNTIFPTIRILYVFSGLTALAAVAGFVWEYLDYKKGTDNKYKVIRGRNLCIASAFTAICSFIAARFFVEGVRILYVIVPIFTVLVLIYLIYSSDFFLISLVTTITGLLMWYYSKAYYNRLITKVDPGVLLRDPTFYIGVVSVLLLIFLAIIVYASSKNSGEIKIGKVSVRLFHSSTKYGLVYLSLALSFACTAAAIVFGSIVAYYLLFVMFGYLFVLAVYYTVKLM